MSTCVEAVPPSLDAPECLPRVQQTDFVFPLPPSPRPLGPTPQTELVDSRHPLVGSSVAKCGRLILCLHSEAVGFEDIYLTFAGAECQNADFEAMLRWLQARISCWRGTSVSIGLGGSKALAAIASRVAPPGAECIVAPGTEETFLAPVSVRKLQGVVHIDARALAERGITTIGELRRIPKPVLVSVFGETCGRALWDAARGRDAQKSGRRFGPGSARCAVTGQPGWMLRLSLWVGTRLEALDRVLGRILAISEEEVPPRTIGLS